MGRECPEAKVDGMVDDVITAPVDQITGHEPTWPDLALEVGV